MRPFLSPDRRVAFRWKFPVWEADTTGEKNKRRKILKKEAGLSCLPSVMPLKFGMFRLPDHSATGGDQGVSPSRIVSASSMVVTFRA
jgi:hypothetical protein